jgi:ABC-type sugar transport system ATPase subunit
MGTGGITLEHVTQRFAIPREDQEFTAVQDASFEVRGGEFASIVGPSGCGKSTLLALVAGLVPVTDGRIIVDGQLARLLPKEIAGDPKLYAESFEHARGRSRPTR